MSALDASLVAMVVFMTLGNAARCALLLGIGEHRPGVGAAPSHVTALVKI